jgi:hypothetical protein
MDQHLRVAFDSLVELVVGDLSILDADLMRDDKAWLRLACDDQVAQVAVVLFDVTLSGREVQSLVSSQ